MRLWLFLLTIGLAGCSHRSERAVLYCAQDEEFAESILADFRRKSGLAVDVKYDTEADKSVSLYLELTRERDRPRCDVYWNNEILSTIRLERQGMLESYSPPGTAWAKPPGQEQAKYYSFAARARILLVNTKLVADKDRPSTLLELTEPRWRSRVAMAKPLFGTTATQAVCLFEVLGEQAARQFYRGLRDNDIQIVPGNKQVAEGVGSGRFAVGLTDTDDALEEVEAGHPVAIIFPDRATKVPRMGTLFIPNTLAIIHGSPNLDAARQLVSYLLSPEIEARLAEGPSHQIPLNPAVTAHLPKELETPKTIQPMQVDFNRAADFWDLAQGFLRETFAR